ncbi:MAG: hypothetical protein ACRD0E_00100 [Acidimicrobiales bacterium]
MKVVSVFSDIGVPIPSTAPAATDHLIMYYGPSPMTPSYTQAGRKDCGAVSGIKAVAVPGAASGAAATLYDVPISSLLPAGSVGSYDFAFTLVDSAGNEGDFSPIVTEAITVPPRLGQPVVL